MGRYIQCRWKQAPKASCIPEVQCGPRKKVNQLKNDVKNGQYVQNSDILFLIYAEQWLNTRKNVRSKNTQKMYRNIIHVHFTCLEGIRLSDIRNSHFQILINNAMDKPRTCQQINITFRQILKAAVIDKYTGAGMLE